MAGDPAQHLAGGPRHDTLAFHHGCPMCRRDRTPGTAPGHGATLRTAGLGLAALALLVTPAAPALANPAPPVTVPDQESEGTPDADAPDTESDPVTVDPDGSDTEDVDSNEAPIPWDGLDSGPVEAPAPPETVDPAEIQDDTPPAPTTPASSEDAAPVPPPRAPAPAPNTQPAAPISDWGSPHRPTPAGAIATLTASILSPDPHATHRHSMPSRPIAHPAEHAAGPGVAEVTGTRPGSRFPKGTGPVSTGTLDAVHTIAPGETLWSIARDRLGGGASAANIAGEVQRIWARNAGRIGTGSPDLVKPGQRLLL